MLNLKLLSAIGLRHSNGIANHLWHNKCTIPIAQRDFETETSGAGTEEVRAEHPAMRGVNPGLQVERNRNRRSDLRAGFHAETRQQRRVAENEAAPRNAWLFAQSVVSWRILCTQADPTPAWVLCF